MADWCEELVPQMTVEAVVPIIPDPATGPTAKIYIRNLHGDTNVDDLVRLIGMVSNATVVRPYLSRLHHGKRYAKFEVVATEADDLLRHFNLFCGVTLAAAEAEYART